MWIQRSICTLTKISGGNITFFKKVHSNTVRTFYNDNAAIKFLIRNINQKRFDLSNIAYKVEEPRKEEKSIFDYVFTPQKAREKHDFLAFYFKTWWQHKVKEWKKFINKFWYEKATEFGPNIAAAVLVLKFGGRVKFYHKKDWFKTGQIRLPFNYDPEYIVEGLDLKAYPIEFEDLNILCNLFQLRLLCLKGCKTIDDWAIDKLAMECPSLEYLDVSNCINLTEKGLVALYKMPNLKKLIVTDFYNSAAFKLTCFMLEDINPYLKCEIHTPESSLVADS
ncbi:distal membrane arm assembly component 2 [Nomia melanderi]|uniref:distal membrane arm assembly component 2 n=1 Tax=Nomia melanderi TaxID=2448451 RepID=UPI0013047095|nr:distal membrane-arm assembly complex protein 2 [Nomia melanderi]